MTAQMKVGELPKAEQDALINEAKELNIRGIVQAQMWGVETLKKKINEAKAAQNPPQEKQEENDLGNDDENNSESVNENQTDTTEENHEENDIGNDDENNNESTDKNENTKATQIIKPVSKPVPTKVEEQPKTKTYICHICRSKVENGKCTGCGFEVFN